MVGAIGALATSTVGVVNDVSDYRKELSEHETRSSFDTPTTSTEAKRNDENRIASGALAEDTSKLSGDTFRDSSDVSKSSSEQDRKVHKRIPTLARKPTQLSRSQTRAEPQKKHHRIASATGHFAESVLGHSLKCQCFSPLVANYANPSTQSP